MTRYFLTTQSSPGGNVSVIDTWSTMKNTLGILVSSDDHFDHLLKLTKAAADKGKTVTIFFTGNGVLMTCNPDFHKLVPYASLKICDVSFRANNLSGDVPGVGFKDFVTQAKHAEIVAESERHITF